MIGAVLHVYAGAKIPVAIANSIKQATERIHLKFMIGLAIVFVFG